jgi:hypothetical protein
MAVSRRDFVKVSTGIAGDTALAGLTGLGANLAPAVARHPQRPDDAQHLPLLLGRLRHPRAHRGGPDRQHRGRSAEPLE